MIIISGLICLLHQLKLTVHLRASEVTQLKKPFHTRQLFQPKVFVFFVFLSLKNQKNPMLTRYTICIHSHIFCRK